MKVTVYLPVLQHGKSIVWVTPVSSRGAYLKHGILFFRLSKEHYFVKLGTGVNTWLTEYVALPWKTFNNYQHNAISNTISIYENIARYFCCHFSNMLHMCTVIYKNLFTVLIEYMLAAQLMMIGYICSCRNVYITKTIVGQVVSPL